MRADQNLVADSPQETLPMASWCKAVIWTDVVVLAIAGLAAILGLFRILRSLEGFMLLAGVLLCSKLVLGGLADADLLSRRGRGLKLAYGAASVAVVGSLFTLVFVNPAAGVHPDSWAFENASSLQVFFFIWSLAWNVLYVFAARKASA